MSRASLSLLCLLLAASRPAVGLEGLDPHLDPALVPGSCTSCHEGHGRSRSPMLPAAVDEVCLGCHGSEAAAAARVEEGVLSPSARPTVMSSALSLPYRHPLTDGASSSREVGAVTCTSCHSPHRAMPEKVPGGPALSPRDPREYEYELCNGCHDDTDVAGIGIVELTSPNARSYHPIQAPTVDRSPSVDEALAGKLIACTSCHGNSESEDAAGPHGSQNPYLLLDPYSPVGHAQGDEFSFALCYDCHDRERLLEGTAFGWHRRHVLEIGASCSTCHDPHGSIENRALIRFGGGGRGGGVSPSLSAGLVAFVSEAPGSGTCYLTCHGADHAPRSYGVLAEEALIAAPAGAITPLQPVALPAGSPTREGMRERKARDRKE